MGESQNLGLVGYRMDVLGTLPKATAASEAMVARSYVRGQGSSFRVGTLIGLDFKVTDNKSTTTTEKTVTFTTAMFANPQSPTLAEVAAALNAAWAEATPTVASVGADGRLVITGAAAGTDTELTIGAGTANLMLGFLQLAKVKYDNGVGIDIVLLDSFTGPGWTEFLYQNAPRVTAFTYTPSTGVHAQDVVALATAGVTATWTPSTRTLRLAAITDAARQIHAIAEF